MLFVGLTYMLEAAAKALFIVSNSNLRAAVASCLLSDKRTVFSISDRRLVIAEDWFSTILLTKVSLPAPYIKRNKGSLTMSRSIFANLVSSTSVSFIILISAVVTSYSKVSTLFTPGTGVSSISSRGISVPTLCRLSKTGIEKNWYKSLNGTLLPSASTEPLRNSIMSLVLPTEIPTLLSRLTNSAISSVMMP